MKNIVIVLLGIVVFISCNQNQVEQAKPSDIPVEEVATLEIEGMFFNFEKNKTGKLPKDWSQAFTGKGDATEWKVVNDNGNKVLAQLSSDNPNYHFNVVVNNTHTFKDIGLAVKLKAVAGKMDQGGGFVWRYTDADNYYVVRANPLEDNVVLYKVINGKRTDLPVLGKGRTYGVDVPPLGNGWNTLNMALAWVSSFLRSTTAI